MESPARVELAYTVLQTATLPLGYGLMEGRARIELAPSGWKPDLIPFQQRPVSLLLLWTRASTRLVQGLLNFVLVHLLRGLLVCHTCTSVLAAVLVVEPLPPAPRQGAHQLSPSGRGLALVQLDTDSGHSLYRRPYPRYAQRPCLHCRLYSLSRKLGSHCNTREDNAFTCHCLSMELTLRIELRTIVYETTVLPLNYVSMEPILRIELRPTLYKSAALPLCYIGWYPVEESNPYHDVRSILSYPLNERGKYYLGPYFLCWRLLLFRRFRRCFLVSFCILTLSHNGRKDSRNQ